MLIDISFELISETFGGNCEAIWNFYMLCYYSVKSGACVLLRLWFHLDELLILLMKNIRFKSEVWLRMSMSVFHFACASLSSNRSHMVHISLSSGKSV